MKFFYYSLTLVAILFFNAITTYSFAQQKPGFINRIATSAAGRLVLDPDGNGYISSTAAGTNGFTTSDDVTTSEITYHPIKAYSTEPPSDLRRGPNHSFSDFVPDASGNGVYFNFDASGNILFRMRVGKIISGSKGYSILMDTDGKFGPTGANADPNYLPSTNGINGNPGFEIEIVLETNSRIAIYNADGTSSPTLITSYTNWQDMSQISIAATNDNGDPDFLIDFYIPFSALQAAPFNLTASSSIRMCATTVMAGKPAIGGPRSDIYGTSTDSYEEFIIGQPGCTIFNTTYSCATAMCTAAPTVNSPLFTGTVNISGTWTKSALPGATSPATITVYKNGVLIGTIPNIATGGTWQLNNIALINNDVISAKAQATGESLCLTSNAVTASLCSGTNIPGTPQLGCFSGSKGLSGSNLSSGWTVHVDNLTRSVSNDNVINTGGLFGANTGTSPNITWIYSGGCSSGAPLTSGSYKIYYTNNVTGCASAPAYFCAGGNGNGNVLASPAAPLVITSPLNSIYTTATKKITGTTDATATLFLYVDSVLVQTVTANGSGVFSFDNLTLLSGQKLFIVNEFNTGVVTTSQCASQTALFTVSCFTQAPVINADNNNQITAGSAITGTSTEPTGSTIRVYDAANTVTPVSTTTVQAGGIWSTTPYTAVAATSYYANAQNGTCGVSTNSATYAAAAPTSPARCGTITGPLTTSGGPGTPNSISGAVTGSFTTTTVNLYMDGELIGTTTTTGTAWGPIAVNTTPANTLYSGAVMTIGIGETNKQEVFCPASATTVLCTPTPAAPLFTPTSTQTINTGQTVTYTISNAVIGTFYAITDATSGASRGKGIWSTVNGNLNITTDPYLAPGTYSNVIRSSSLSGVTLCSATSSTATVQSNGLLAVNLLNFSGTKAGTGILLNWIVSNEDKLARYEIERSSNGFGFNKIGEQLAGNIINIQKLYSFTDRSPFAKKNYYRLKLVDTDGKYSYSKLVVFSNGSSSSMIINDPTPNPFKESFKLNVDLAQATILNISLADVAGRIVYTHKVGGHQGINLIEFNNLRRLGGGMYLLLIKTADASAQQKVLKIN